MKTSTVCLVAVFVGLAPVGMVGISLGQEVESQDVARPRELEHTSLALQGLAVDEVDPAPDRAPNPVEQGPRFSALAASGGPAAVSALAWQTTTVDDAGEVGTYTSLALDVEDLPHISYRDYRRMDLRYAHFDGATWISETVDAVDDAGLYTSLALDSTDQPHIVHCAKAIGAPASLTRIRYASTDGVTWISETIDSAGLGGAYTSLALDSHDRPHISYYHSPTGDLAYVRHDGADWITETVVSAGDGGGYTSLALDRADHPHISYYDGANGDLRYATHDGVAWISDTVDSGGDVGLYTSLALDSDDRPHIGYCLGSGAAAACTQLRYAYYDGADWITETVTSDDALTYISLALDGAGSPHIAYRGSAGLKVARLTSDGWPIETADGGDVGDYPSLALDSAGYPHVSYHDGAGGSLRYAEYDLTPPTIISGPAVFSITQDSAVVIWQTDEPADSVVWYDDQAGTTNLEEQETSLVEEHSLSLSGLEPSTLYHYFVESTDAASNTVTSPEGFFETAPVSDSVPPVASSLEFVRDEGLYDLYRFSATVSDTNGVERVEFYMDEVLIGTDYAPSSPVYETYMHPFVQGITREDFFTNHTMKVVAFDHAGLSSHHEEILIPLGEPMDGELRIESPDPGTILYIEGNFVPAGTTVDIEAYAVEYEWVSLIDTLVMTPSTPDKSHRRPNGPLNLQATGPAAPPGPFKQVPNSVFQNVLYSTQVDRAVAQVDFLIDDTLVQTSTPSSEKDFYHDYSWNISGYPSGTHKITVKAYDNEDKILIRNRHIGIFRGEPSFDLTRSVSRIDNYFQVSLTLTNQGTGSADVASILDNVYGFQPVRAETPPLQDPAYRVSTECSLDVTHCDVAIDLGVIPGGTITLDPGESLTVDYLVVPILPTSGWQHAIGPYAVVIGYYDGLIYREQEIVRPCYSTEEGELNPVAWAKAEADYLIVTNPAYVRFHNFLDEESVENLLSKLAELAVLEQGILGYVSGSVGDVMDPNFVDSLITQWGAGMKGSDGTADGFLSNGYLLLVGETEILPAHSKYMSPPWYASWAPSLHIDMTDMYYANTGGSSINPELMVGRMIGNSATDLLTPTQTSISVHQSDPSYSFDRSHGLILSGWDECRSGECSDIDFSDEAQDIRSKLQNRGTQASIFYTTNYVSPTVAANTFLSLASGQDIIHLVGHGNPWSCDDLWTGDVTDLSDPFGYANPFVYGSSCLTGRYSDGQSLAEAFLMQGAGVYIGSTEVSYCCTNRNVAKKFYNRWDPGESIGHALKQTKVDVGAYDPGRLDRGYMEDMWTAEYHLFGDPKYGLWELAPPQQGATTRASGALTVTPGLTASLPVTIPAYEITTTLEGKTFVDIPGGFTVMEADKPLVPLYDVSVEYPKGTSVQDVVMTSRAGLTTTTGLSLTNFSLAESGCGCGCVSGAATASPGWWPERDFDWSIQESPAGTQTLNIRIYPFYYNPQTTDVKFYQDYVFEVHAITTTVEVSLLTTDADAYAQGDEVSIELWLSNPGAPQDVIVDAVVRDGSTGEVVDGLPLRSLKDMTGVSSFSYGWDSGDFGSGQHIVEAEVRDDGGQLLDRAMMGFELGIHAGQVVTFTATPESFDVGDTISISLVFSNTGTLPITGTAVIEVQDKNAQVVEEFRHDFGDLAPASAVRFDEGWDTSATEPATFSIVGTTLYGGKSSAGVVIVSSLRRVYLPIVLRGS
jgi:hypothetical protein